jgi:hypothetical protein
MQFKFTIYKFSQFFYKYKICNSSREKKQKKNKKNGKNNSSRNENAYDSWRWIFSQKKKEVEQGFNKSTQPIET